MPVNDCWRCAAWDRRTLLDLIDGYQKALRRIARKAELIGHGLPSRHVADQACRVLAETEAP